MCVRTGAPVRSTSSFPTRHPPLVVPAPATSSFSREDHVQTVSNPGQSLYTVQPCPSLQTWRGLFGCDGGGEGLLVSTPLGSGVPSSPPDGGVAWKCLAVSERTLLTVLWW